MEHSLRYRLYHARARQCGRNASDFAIHYESLADDIDGELARLFRFLGVGRMTVAERRPHFDQEWDFIGNISLFYFDGVIRPARHQVSSAERTLIRVIGGTGF